MLWPLYVIVAAAGVAALVVLLRDREFCPESESGKHHDLYCFRDTEFGRVVFHRCLHCLRATPGIETPWIELTAPEPRQ